MKRRVAIGIIAGALLLGYAGKRYMDSQRVFGNIWNSDAVNMMIAVFHKRNGHYPAHLHDMDGMNVDPMRGPGPAQDLERNLWGQRYIYTSISGGGYTFISPGRHGYRTDRIVPWPRYDGPSNADTSLIFKSEGNAFTGFLGLPKGQVRP